MLASQNPQPVSKRLRLTSRGSVDTPLTSVVDALGFDLTREDSSVAGERDDMGLSAPPTTLANPILANPFLANISGLWFAVWPIHFHVVVLLLCCCCAVVVLLLCCCCVVVASSLRRCCVVVASLLRRCCVVVVRLLCGCCVLLCVVGLDPTPDAGLPLRPPLRRTPPPPDRL